MKSLINAICIIVCLNYFPNSRADEGNGLDNGSDPIESRIRRYTKLIETKKFRRDLQHFVKWAIHQDKFDLNPRLSPVLKKMESPTGQADFLLADYRPPSTGDYCYDDHTGASVPLSTKIGDMGGDICVSLKRAAELVLSEAELFSGFLHEHAHHVGYENREAYLLENFSVLTYSEFRKKFPRLTKNTANDPYNRNVPMDLGGDVVTVSIFTMNERLNNIQTSLLFRLWDTAARSRRETKKEDFPFHFKGTAQMYADESKTRRLLYRINFPAQNILDKTITIETENIYKSILGATKVDLHVVIQQGEILIDQIVVPSSGIRYVKLFDTTSSINLAFLNFYEKEDPIFD